VLIKSLVGLTRVDEGIVRFEDIDLVGTDERTMRAERARIGFVFQASALFDSITVAENVAYPLRIRRGAKLEEIAARVAECLDLVGLSGAGPLMPAELSGGMRKRVAVARGLAARPNLLLAAEPTAAARPAH